MILICIIIIEWMDWTEIHLVNNLQIFGNSNTESRQLIALAVGELLEKQKLISRM